MLIINTALRPKRGQLLNRGHSTVKKEENQVDAFRWEQTPGRQDFPFLEKPCGNRVSDNDKRIGRILST